MAALKKLIMYTCISIFFLSIICCLAGFITYVQLINPAISNADFTYCQCSESVPECSKMTINTPDALIIKVILPAETKCDFTPKVFNLFYYCDITDLVNQLRTVNNIEQKQCTDSIHKEEFTTAAFSCFAIAIILFIISVGLFFISICFRTETVDAPVIVNLICAAFNAINYTNVEAFKTAVASETQVNLNDNCSICIEAICPTEPKDFQPVLQLPECKHWFHTKCIIPWISRNNTCPLCRAVVAVAEVENTSGAINDTTIV